MSYSCLLELVKRAALAFTLLVLNRHVVDGIAHSPDYPEQSECWATASIKDKCSPWGISTALECITRGYGPNLLRENVLHSLLCCLDCNSRMNEAWERKGRQLARMHRNKRLLLSAFNFKLQKSAYCLLELSSSLTSGSFKDNPMRNVKLTGLIKRPLLLRWQ